MFRGYFKSEGARRAPYLSCNIRFPDLPRLGTASVDLLVDTGAETTILARTVAENIGLDLATLLDGGTSTGIGGTTATRTVRADISVADYSITMWLKIQESQHSVPSVLGRDFMQAFALFIEQSTSRVLFLDQADVETYGLAALGNP